MKLHLLHSTYLSLLIHVSKLILVLDSSKMCSVRFFIDILVLDLIKNCRALTTSLLSIFLFNFLHRLHWLGQRKELSNELIQLILIHIIDSNDSPHAADTAAASDRHKFFNVSLLDFAQVLKMHQKLWILHQSLRGNHISLVVGNLRKNFQEVSLISYEGD
jgi:hypothetical protein